MFATVVMGNREKSFLNSDVIKISGQTFHDMVNMINCLLQVQIKFQ